MTTAMMSPNGTVGYIPKLRTVRVECDWPDLAPADPDGERLWAEIEDLTFDEQAAIPYGQQFRYRDVWTAIAPAVHAWNVMGRNRETREYEPLPPPAEGGIEVLSKCDKLITQWLALELKFGPLPNAARDEKKDSFASTPEPANATPTDSSPEPSSMNGTSSEADPSTSDPPTTTA